MFCVKCGKWLQDGSKFCVHCGSATVYFERVCDNCGKQMAAGKKVCDNCGKRTDGILKGADLAPAINAQRQSASVRCASCGNEIAREAKFCRFCGSSVPQGGSLGQGGEEGTHYCWSCGKEVGDAFNFCPHCETPQTISIPSSSVPQTPPAIMSASSQANAGVVPTPKGEKSKIAAGLLAIFLGGLGIHKFYLGYNTAGGIMLGVWLFGILLYLFVSAILGDLIILPILIVALIEGIIYLTKPEDEFYQTYVLNKKEWF